jgi:hypothetical protein
MRQNLMVQVPFSVCKWQWPFGDFNIKIHRLLSPGPHARKREGLRLERGSTHGG